LFGNLRRQPQRFKRKHDKRKHDNSARYLLKNSDGGWIGEERGKWEFPRPLIGDAETISDTSIYIATATACRASRSKSGGDNANPTDESSEKTWGYGPGTRNPSPFFHPSTARLSLRLIVYLPDAGLGNPRAGVSQHPPASSE
jgi:hypothetical protein